MAAKPWEELPPPTAGEPTRWVEAAPLLTSPWSIIVEGQYTPAGTPLSTYGQAGTTYGEGPAGGSGGLDWIEFTCEVVSVDIRRGDADAVPFVPVDEATLVLRDLEGDLQPIVSTPTGPTVGTMLRVSVTNGATTWPLFTGRVGELEDAHDRPPRILTTRCYGVVSDLSETIATYIATAEAAQQRVDSLLQAVGWRWGVEPLPVSPTLTGWEEQTAPVVRALLNNTAISAGLSMSTDGAGVLRFLPWPTPIDSANGIEVTDKLGQPELAAVSIDYRADDFDLVNVAVCATLENGTAEAEDVASVSYFGRRTRGSGMPLTDLRCSHADAQAIADAVVARHSRVTHRVDSISVSSRNDWRWPSVLATLDIGLQVTVKRVGLTSYPSELVGYVVGWEHRLTPGEWAATIYLSTTTTTL